MTTLIVPPKAPSKFVVIPIHASDRGTFKKCRRRWHWTSPMRENLSVSASEHGIYFPLWFGSGIHWALKQYYDPALKRDLIETFKTWYDIQWNGGVISEDWLEITYDRQPQQVKDGWKVRGLYDILPAPDLDGDTFEEHLDLGIGMLTFYRDYAERNDNFTVIAAEHTFSVPILDFDGNTVIRTDVRDGKSKEVHLRGTMDAIIQDNDTGKFGILEHKSAISIGEEYFEKLDKDEQCTTYMYAGEREATIHGLPYTKIDFVLYNALRKAYPKPPTITQRGLPSIDRKQESTTYPMLLKAIEDLGIEGTWPDKENEKNYVEFVKNAGDEQFIIRTPVIRNRNEIVSCGVRVFMEVEDMLGDPYIYPNPTGEWYCLRCPFRAPCIAVDDGSDWKFMIEDQYEKNWTR